MENHYQYYAFISYKREDENRAKWLQRKLEGYRLPSIIRKDRQDLPAKVKPVFLDQTDIVPGVLNDVLKEELAKSRYLIVICSPNSAKSEWVGKEIEVFVEMGRVDKIIPFIVDGEPYSRNPDTECLHPVLRNLEKELLGVNIHEAGKESAFIKKEKAVMKVVARMFELPFDTLWQRQKRRMVRNVSFMAAAFLVFLLTVGFVWKAGQPFDMRVAFNETSFHNQNLPIENGKLVLRLDEETKELPVNSFDSVYVFQNIPAKYKRQPVSFSFKMYGFESVDTTLWLNNNTTLLRVKRDFTYQNIYGIIKNSKGKPLNDIRVEVAKKITHTDNGGEFYFAIPLDKQQTKYSILISDEKKQMIDSIYPDTKENKALFIF